MTSLSAFNPSDLWNQPLRIQRKGTFLNDDWFADSRSHFESAASDLLKEFDLGKNEDVFSSYRRLRDHQLTGTNRTVKVAEEKEKFTIVVDVEGFSEDALQVKVAGPDEIVVEGSQEVVNGGNIKGSSSKFKKSFKRRFNLPTNALVQDATSVLSSDNVLTISIPKRITEITDEATEQRIKEEQIVQQQKLLQQQHQELEKQQRELQQRKEELHKETLKTESELVSDNFWNLPIVPKQSFFNDSFFENVRQNFQKSVKDLMDKRTSCLTSSNDLGVMNRVRETSVGDAQAVSITEDAKEHKIVLDVHGFLEGDLKVRAISETTLSVEGKVEKKTEFTSCSHNFNKQFTLPSSVEIRQATSALSSEGILTITVPKKIEAIDYNIPVRSDAANLLSNVIKKEQGKESSNTSNTTSTSTQIQNSQQLLSTIEKQIEEDKKICENLDRKEHYVPINMENETLTQRTNVPVFNEPSQVVKESQRLVSESTKLMEEANASERKPVVDNSSLNMRTDTTNLTSKILNTETSSNISTPTSSVPQYRPHNTRVIPINIKGSFYNESIFDDARQSIDREVQDILTKYRQTSVVDKQSSVIKANKENVTQTTDLQKTEDNKENVTQTTDLQKMGDTTTTILDDTKSYKVVVDVYGFEEKELSIKITSSTELSIEGNSEKEKDGSITKHSFQRTFKFPDFADLERATTALSEEGLLTVTIPKKNQIMPIEKKTSTASRHQKSVNESNQIKTTLVVDSTGVVQDHKVDNATLQSTTVPSSTNREYVVPVTLEDASDVSSVAGSTQSTSDLTSQMSTVSNTSRDVSQDDFSRSTSVASVDSQIQNQSNLKNKERMIQIQEQSADDSLASSNLSNQTRETVTKTLFDMPIVSRGHFFDDNIFQDSRSTFESLLRNKMNRFNRSSSFVDDLGFFKSLRENRITSGNQMANLSEDDKFNKIVLDVHGFDATNLTVRAISEREVVIEGSIEEKAGPSMSKRTFKRCYQFPGPVDLKGANSVLSSDGVLHIKIPKSL